MTYLLDVNALLAWRHARAPHHQTFHAWAARVQRKNLRTCALAELGFIRVSMQVFGYTLAQAQDALRDIERELGGYVESAPSPRLPAWATTAARTSDAYLAQVAAANGVRLATFDAALKDVVVELIG
jgi:predicted nucleic acid-binding protein